LRDSRFKVSQNQLKNIREIRNIRKKIAQILTILKQKKASAKNEQVK
jgi:ribosomal protein L29